MSKQVQTEARLALQVALNLLDKFFSAGEFPIWEEELIRGNIVDELPSMELLNEGSKKKLRQWKFVYNATYIPSCCAGQCLDFTIDVVGNIDIITPNRTYSFSMDTLVLYEWDI